MALIRFILVGLLAFVVIRFLVRLVAEVRSFVSGRTEGAARAPQRREQRDIQDATFEDLTGENHEQKPGP